MSTWARREASSDALVALQLPATGRATAGSFGACGEWPLHAANVTSDASAARQNNEATTSLIGE
jgi:hypothetical protein